MNLETQNKQLPETVEKPKKIIKKKDGILIYDEARTKLQISKSGKIYKQKFAHYIPFVGPTFSLVYANLVIGKTRCLRNADSKRFKRAGRSINWHGFFIWPIAFLGIWALLTYLLMDFGSAGEGSYQQMWTSYIDGVSTLINNMKGKADVSADIAPLLSNIISGFIVIWVTPLLNFGTVELGTAIQSNLIFILSILILTMINPVNIYNALVINSNKRRFIVVLEDSSVYQEN